tara:strand:+ start:2150 stop:2380 length:231 start_codon:yes stop_codon:yes gene_type:complete
MVSNMTPICTMALAIVLIDNPDTLQIKMPEITKKDSVTCNLIAMEEVKKKKRKVKKISGKGKKKKKGFFSKVFGSK